MTVEEDSLSSRRFHEGPQQPDEAELAKDPGSTHPRQARPRYIRTSFCHLIIRVGD
jgi:hypothetical protein